MRATSTPQRERPEHPDWEAWPALGAAACLRRRAVESPDAVALRYLKKGGAETSEHSFRALDLEARRLAAWLRRNGTPGDRVLLAHAPGPEFVPAFFACLYAGFIAVPAFPPRKARHGDRVGKILRDADCALALADPLGRAALETARVQEGGVWERLRRPAPEDLAGLAPLTEAELNRPAPDDLAFLQYTSGSTGAPKGVMVTHGNVLHNLGAQASQLDFRPGDVFVSWVPFFHDMGLVLGVLLPLHGDGSGVYLSPGDFLKTPADWLRALSAFGGTHSCAPNFAFDLCVRSVGEGERQGMDLARWRYCGNGSEPVRPDAMRRFEQSFAPQGVRPGLVQPGYGLAENTLYVAACPPLAEAVLWEGHPGPAGRGLAGCGQAPGHRVLIVDPVTRRARADGEAGEIWVQGGSVAKGYWRKPEESAATFKAELPGQAGTFLRTGDLGFWHQGSLVINGRLKDLVIVRGVNYHPEDLEATVRFSVQEALGLGAAFAVEGPEGEELVLVQEVPRHPEAGLDALAEGMARALSREHGIRVKELLLVPPHAVPATSSGKVQRRACRAVYLDGGLKVLARWPKADAEAPEAAWPATAASYAERLGFVRETALALGGVEPSEGERAPLDAWCLDSLHMAELSGLYQKRYGTDLGALNGPGAALRDLLKGAEAEAPVPAGPASGLGLAPLAEPDSPAPALKPQGAVDPVRERTHEAQPRRWRCHAALESLWVFQRAAPGSNAYHLAWTLQGERRLDPGRLTAALGVLTEAEPALRCGFELDGQSRLWQIEAPPAVPLERPWDGEGSLAQARTWVQDWNRRTFDPAKPPLWKAAYLPLEGGGCFLAFVFHHLIFDRRSAEAFLEALQRLLLDPDAESRPRAGLVPRWTGDAEALDRARAYWSERLKGLSPEPWLRRGPLLQPGPLRALKASISAETLDALKRLASDAPCTLFTVAALAWAEALAGQSDQGEACFIVPSTLRDQPLSERQLGYWVHPLPLRLKADLGRALPERLAEATRSLREAMAHRQINLAQAMRLVGLPAPATLLNYHAASPECVGFAGQTARLRVLPPDTCLTAMALEVTEGDGWGLRLEYDALAVDEALARACLDAFVAACGRCARASGARSDAPEPEPGASRGPRTVLDAFHARVLADAKATALVHDHGQMDYGTLYSQVRSVAGALFQAGVRPGDRVGVCSQASPAWVAAMLGCFELSAVYVPLDPAYPPERLKIMVEDAACRAVLSDQGRPAWASACAGPWMDLHQTALAQGLYLQQSGRPAPEDPAYIIFTSGSTGRPKGVQVNHRALLNHALGSCELLGIGGSDRVMQFFSISFDGSLQDAVPTLVAGACLVLSQRQGTPGAGELAGFIRRHRVTHFCLPAAYWHAFMQADGAKHLRGADDLRCAMTGGEAPAPRLVSVWNQTLPTVKFYNVYGPTEACIVVSMHECRHGESPDAPIPLGGPLPGVELAVVGPDGKILPQNEAGELWISGICLADGYIRPGGGLDKAKFAPASPDGKPERAFYRTGDLAVLDAQGRLVYKGRMDREFKAAGIRMDLGEIEAVLAQAHGVANAVVEVEGKGEDVRLRAWVLAKTGSGPSPSDLKAWLKQRIHPACVPADLAVLAEFPLGPSGKIDRKALKNMVWSGELPQAGAPKRPDAVSESPAVPALSARQAPLFVPDRFAASDWVEALRAAFSQILDRAVGPDDDFFGLGGTSLRAVRLAGEASRRLERNVLVDQIYHAPTPRALAALLNGGPVRAEAPRAGILRPLAQGPGPDWVLLPPGSGRLACYRGLAHLLQGQARVWGLDLSALPAPEDGAWEGWVRTCAETLERALPTGDLVLGGWSMGGLLAADLSRVLTARGRTVRRLLLMDAYVPDPLSKALAIHDPYVLEDMMRHDLEAGGGPLEGQTGEEERRRYRLYLGAMANYCLSPVPVPLSLVLSERTAREEARAAWMAWSLMARAGMTCRLVPGDHHSVLSENNLKRLAEFLLQDTNAEPMERLVAA